MKMGTKKGLQIRVCATAVAKKNRAEHRKEEMIFTGAITEEWTAAASSSTADNDTEKCKQTQRIIWTISI